MFGRLEWSKVAGQDATAGLGMPPEGVQSLP